MRAHDVVCVNGQNGLDVHPSIVREKERAAELGGGGVVGAGGHVDGAAEDDARASRDGVALLLAARAVRARVLDCRVHVDQLHVGGESESLELPAGTDAVEVELDVEAVRVGVLVHAQAAQQQVGAARVSEDPS